jgi:hypothetical protein
VNKKFRFLVEAPIEGGDDDRGRRSSLIPQRPRSHVHFFPTGACWMNVVKRWFALLTEKQIRRDLPQHVNFEMTIRNYVLAMSIQSHPSGRKLLIKSWLLDCKRILVPGH